MKIVRLVLFVIFMMAFIMGGLALSINRYHQKTGIEYLRKIHPNAATVQFVAYGHNTSYFVVVDSTYQVTSYVSYNGFGDGEMKKVED